MPIVTSIKRASVQFSDIKRWHDENLAIGKIDLDDQRVYENVYHDGHFPGIFQCTSQGAQRLFVRAKPTSILDVATLTSIYRPGPLAAHVDKLYLEAKNEGKEYDWGDHRINDLLKDTYGLLIFQEGVMFLAEKVAGFPKDKCDEVRRAIMKRSISGGADAKAKVDAMKDEFVAGAVKNDYAAKVASDLYEKIAWFSGYAFNKSHAVAYAIDSYWCAWLLTHHEEQWLCAYLESMSNTPDNKAEAFAYVKQMGYQIVPIDINHAALGWTVLPGKRLMPSMTSCKGVGDSAVEEIMEMRPFSDIEQLLWNEDGTWRPSKFNRKAMEALIKVKAFDSLNCVGPDAVFKSYRHMHEVLVGSYEEEVTRKRGGVEQTSTVVREHSNMIRRSSKKDPHEGRKAFYALARGLVETHGDEWERKEQAELHAEVFGSVDIMMMFEPALFERLREKNVRSVEELEAGETDLVWFVTVIAAGKKGKVASSGTMKKTKNQKMYAQIFASGPTGKPLRINVWGAKELCEPYKLFVAEVKKDDYGLSTVTFKMKEIA